MKTPALERTSAAKAGWLIIVLTLGWMAFVLWPGPPEVPADKPASIPVPSSSLTRAGLRDYTDWQGLPEIFAIWADQAEWKDNHTRFAYWHPVMKTYSYYFEAVRTMKGYRFREIPEPHDANHLWDESLGEDCPIRFYRSLAPEVKMLEPSVHTDPAGSAPLRVKLDMAAPKIPVPVIKDIRINQVPKP